MASTDPERMTTYKRADGELMCGEWGWVTEMDSVEAEAYDAIEPIEFIEEVWVRQSVRTFKLPTCNQCDEDAEYWGLCEKHAREDDPEHFETKAEA